MNEFMTFDQHMERYEMGQAYKAITTAMGPSPQLVAFVNYDQVKDDSLGLESFDIVAQHDAILAQIDADPALQLATESLADVLHRSGKYMRVGGGIAIGAAIGGGVGVFVLPAAGTIGAIGVAAIIAGRIVEHVGAEESATDPYQTFSDLSTFFKEQLLYDIQYTQAIPKGFTLKEWKDFESTIRTKGWLERLFTKSYNIEKPKAIASRAKVPFNDSDWNAARLSIATKWIKDNSEHLAHIRENYAARADAVAKWVETDHKEDKEAREVMKIISKTMGLTPNPFSGSDRVLATIKGILDTVAHRFEEEK